MTGRVRYTVQDVTSNRFYQMPKFLFEGEFKNLSNDSRVLYSLLKDRHELSLTNNWVNESGEVYLIYTRKNMEEMLGLADKTIKKACDQLKELGLMEEERIGLNKPNRIYLTAVTPENGGIVNFTIQEPENLRFKNRNIYDSRTEENTIQESKNLRSNNTDINNTDTNNTNLSINHEKIIKGEAGYDGLDGLDKDISSSNKYNTYKKIITENIQANDLKRQYRDDAAVIDEVINLLAETITTSKPYIRVCGEDKPADVVKAQLLKLNSEHIEYVISCLNSNAGKVQNIKAYMLTSLFNAPSTMTVYYANLAQSDMRERPFLCK
ncbi:replication initiator protein A [Patescibacteria group bacterium]|nr:replication initiator protein A [Patescibacteria group bacterium]